MRPPDHNIFVKDAVIDGKTVKATVTQVGKKIEDIYPGDRVLIERGKYTAFEHKGVQYASVPLYYVMSTL